MENYEKTMSNLTALISQVDSQFKACTTLEEKTDALRVKKDITEALRLLRVNYFKYEEVIK